MTPFATPKRLRLYSLGALCGVALGFVALIATSNGLETAFGGRLGGDFPAFYGAGLTVRKGLAQSLYEPSVQQQMQDAFLPKNPGGWIHFAYPPFVAIAYVPLTYLSFKAAYVVHTCFMVGCCALALWMLRAVLPRVPDHFGTIFGVVVTFYPLYRAVAGGQNSAVSLLCAAGAIAALETKREFTAGVWLGLWLFKPQFAILVALAVCLRSWRALAGFSLVAAIYALASAAMFGLAWPQWWLTSASAFMTADSAVDRGNGISLIEVGTELGARSMGVGLAVIVAVAALGAAFRYRMKPAAAIGLSSAAAPLISPHALYYDGALALLALVFPAQATGSAVLSWLAAVWTLGAMHWIRAVLPLPPVTVALFVALIACVVSLRRDAADDYPEARATELSRATRMPRARAVS
jgi:alpha-1,2-mannosyltransferase